MRNKVPNLPHSAVTPKNMYLNRRRFLTGTAAAFAAPKIWEMCEPGSSVSAAAKLAAAKSPFSADEKLTSYEAVTHYNNFYEFGTGKTDPAEQAKNFRTTPWTIAVEGEVGKPKTYDLDSIMKVAPLEERVYRMRCVEGWSMVIPWIGFPLAAVLKLAEPTSKGKYVAFTSYYDHKQMPQAGGIRFPYVEGLRLDEAMNPLTILSVGLYGETLPNQNGAPIRLVVPWKYGFKGIKSIVKIRLTEKQPPTTWSMANGQEYGFYSNVNPEVDHPRWSQAKERRIGEFFKRDTLKFNGYGDHVASLYSGMDLRKNY